MATSPRTKIVLIAAAAALPVALAMLLFPGSQAAEVKILDPRFHVISCRTSVGMVHAEGNTVTAAILNELHKLGARVRPRLVSHTSAKSIGLIVRYDWDGLQSDVFSAEMADEAGRVYPLRMGRQGAEFHPATQVSEGTAIWLLEGPPRQDGNYEFRIRAASNGPPVATWKTRF